MYNCRKLTRKEIESVYSLYMKKDFPKDELKPLSMINRSLDKGQYFCYGMFDDDKLCGYACFVSIDIDSKQCCLLDYFAVLSDMRDKGIGSAFLRLLKDELDPAEIVLCESESPEDTENEELVTRKRRIAFYLRNDLTDTGVTASVFGVKYVLLEFPVSRQHSGDEVRGYYSALYKSFLPEHLYNKFVSIDK